MSLPQGEHVRTLSLPKASTSTLSLPKRYSMKLLGAAGQLAPAAAPQALQRRRRRRQDRSPQHCHWAQPNIPIGVRYRKPNKIIIPKRNE